MVEDDGVTAIEVKVDGSTTTLEVAETPPREAVMVAVPADSPIAWPYGVTDTTDGVGGEGGVFVLLQVAAVPRF